jgi:tetratricopeptide (TPR) repeat protein
MNGRLTRPLTLAAAALLTALPAQAQELGRFRVLVPDFYALQGADRDFGEDAAKDLRDLLKGLPTHQPIERGKIRDQVREFDMRMRDLDCLKTRQLATQINAQIVLCANYTEQDETRQLTGLEFWDMNNSEALAVEPITVTGRDGRREAAQHIFQAFDRMVQLARAQQFCAEYAVSQQWDNALRNCDQALALNPSAMSSRQRKARIHFEQAQAETDPQAKRTYFQQALKELEQILEANQFHEEALQLGGFVSIQLGDEEKGRSYYYRYLEVNPGADRIRLNIAYDMNQAGDPEGAMELVAVGLETAPENADLITYYANYGFAAANKRATQAQAAGGASGVPAEAQALYREVISALNKVAAIRGAEMPVGLWRTVVASHIQLGDVAQAEAAARQVLQTHPQDAVITDFLANALQKQGRIDEAVATLDRVQEIKPDDSSVNVRQGSWLITAGRLDDAVPYFRRAVQRGDNANTMARIIFGDAVNNGVRKDAWDYALRGLLAAKTFDVTPETRTELNFWHGWTIYHQAMLVQEPQNLESAERSKPMFEQARDLYNAGRGYASRAGMNLQQILDAVNSYIEIQAVLIRRLG